ncbi:NAD(P)-binding protein, partial [Violaceomyces palustris]
AVDQRKVVLITGCSSGIGRALAIEFDSLNHLPNSPDKFWVFATARNLQSLTQLPSGIERVQLDVNDQASVKSAVHLVTSQTSGRIDILINNAGTNLAVGPVIETDLSRMRSTFEPNFFGLISVTQAVAPFMIKSGRGGKIVNIGSTAAYAALPYGATYSASKAAVHALSDALRLELAGFGIRVIVVAPGAIRSSIGDAGSSNVSVSSDSFYKDVEDMIFKRANYSQTGKPEPTPTDIFARDVRKELVKKCPRAYITSGSRSFGAWLGYYMPIWLKDWIVGRIFQTSRIG